MSPDPPDRERPPGSTPGPLSAGSVEIPRSGGGWWTQRRAEPPLVDLPARGIAPVRHEPRANGGGPGAGDSGANGARGNGNGGGGNGNGNGGERV